jgi:putative ABC transport system substrate-binding protein
MTHRVLGLMLTLGLLAAPLAADAQTTPGSKAAKIGFLLGSALSSPSVQIEPFKQVLREKGWNEGQNLTPEYRAAEGYYERLPALARELVDLGVDVIVTEGSPPTRAAIQVTKTVPIVMVSTGDPVGSGFVRSLAHPGGNLTGASFFFSEINAKRVELLKEALPGTARIAVVYNPLNPVHEPAVQAIEAIAKLLKVRIERLTVSAPADFDAVFPRISGRSVNAVTILEDGVINSQSLRLIDAALKARVPSVFGLSSLVAAGGFMSYAPSRPELWRKAGCSRTRFSEAPSPAISLLSTRPSSSS